MKSRLKQIIASLSIFAVFLVTFFLVLPSVQSAQASLSDCPSGKVCVWTSTGFPGAPAYYWTVPSGSGGVCFNYGPGLNDNVDSIAVKGGRSATQYRDANCTGTTVSFHYGINYGSPWSGGCGVWGWACYVDGAGSYLPSSVWVIK